MNVQDITTSAATSLPATPLLPTEVPELSQAGFAEFVAKLVASDSKPQECVSDLEPINAKDLPSDSDDVEGKDTGNQDLDSENLAAGAELGSAPFPEKSDPSHAESSVRKAQVGSELGQGIGALEKSHPESPITKSKTVTGAGEGGTVFMPTSNTEFPKTRDVGTLDKSKVDSRALNEGPEVSLNSPTQGQTKISKAIADSSESLGMIGKLAEAKITASTLGIPDSKQNSLIATGGKGESVGVSTITAPQSAPKTAAEDSIHLLAQHEGADIPQKRNQEISGQRSVIENTEAKILRLDGRAVQGHFNQFEHVALKAPAPNREFVERLEQLNSGVTAQGSEPGETALIDASEAKETQNVAARHQHLKSASLYQSIATAESRWVASDVKHGLGLELIPTPLDELGAVGPSLTASQKTAYSQLGTAIESEIPRAVSRQLAEVSVRAMDRPFEIKLDPEELGRVRMVLSGTDTHVTVSIVAERIETTELMRRHLHLLAEDFREMGYDEVSFSFGQEGPANDSSHMNQGSGPDHSDNSDCDVSRQVPDLSSLVTEGRVDIRI